MRARRPVRRTLQDRLFRAVIRLLPEETRAGYAGDMEATFRAARREATGRARAGALARLWLATIGDVIRVAPGEHLDVLRRDLRVAARAMAARPGHTMTAVATLAIGIGANIAMFAVVDAVLLSPLPYRDPAALVTVAETEAGGDPSNLGYLTFVDLKAGSRSFETLVAVAASTATLTDWDRDAERVNAMRASRTYFDMLGVRPALGRTFTEAEDRPGAARRVVILSDALWRRRFGADPAVVGRPVSISGTEYRVVGVLPADFEDLVASRMYGGAEIWYPLGYDPAAAFACRTCRHLRVFGRLAPGVAPDAAQRELDRIFASLEQAYPSEYHAAGAEVTPLTDVLLGPVRPALLVLWAGVGALLLVACGNVANLQLFRATERAHEIAVRTALGVTRGRLARQLLTESVLLGLAGGLAGLGPAWAVVRLVAITGPAQIPRLEEAAVDLRVVVATVALTMASAVVFGLVPLRQVLRQASASTLHGAGRRTGSARTWRVRSALVGANVALAALLLVGSGLLVRSVSGLLAVSPGLDPSGVLTMRIWASGPAFRDGTTDDQVATAARFYDEVLERARALPGVTAAAGVTTLPLGGGVDAYGFHIEGRPSANPEAAPNADRFVVTPDFFSVLRIPLVRGRLLDVSDHQEAAPVVVINRTAAQALFGGTDPVGQRVSLGPPTAVARTIVGIVEDVRHHGLDEPVGYQVYVPQAQWAWAETFLTLVVRSAGDPLALASPMRDIVRAVDPAQPVTDIAPYEAVVTATTGARRFTAGLLTAFAVAALLMAVVGLYGSLGVMVGQRRREIGLRMALGAHGRQVRRLVLARALGPVGLGLVAGLGLARLSARGLGSMLYRVEALDAASFGGSAVLLLGAALLASLLPAWRASRIDPATTLRAE